jgi:hypothetical protein
VRSRWIAAVVVVLATTAAIDAPLLRAWFLDDDFGLLLGGRTFDPARLLQVSGRTHFYRPLVEVYFAATVRLVGYSAFAFHLLNLVVHSLNSVLLLVLAARLTRSLAAALAAAVLFATLPGYTQAVGWVSAITALLAGTWSLTAAIAHARYLRHGHVRDYAVVLAATLLALGTHESTVAIAPMLVSLELLIRPASARPTNEHLPRAILRYAPLALLVAAYLLISWIINTQNYVVTEGHYALGVHAIGNALNYIVSMYVGKRTAFSYVAIVATAGLVLWRGTPIARFAVCWIAIFLAPVVWFMWGNASRYLYVPSMGFALLLMEGLRTLERAATRRSWRAAHAAVALLMVAAAVRFGLFAHRAALNFVSITSPYERYAHRVRAALDAGQVTLPAPGPGINQRYVGDLVKLISEETKDRAARSPGS